VTDYSETVKAQLRRAVVRKARFVIFDFLSGPVQVWDGTGPIKLAGGTWQGLGRLGRVSTISSGPALLGSNDVTFELFGDDGLFASIGTDQQESFGRQVGLYTQFFDIRRFDETGAWVDWQPLDDLKRRFLGVMGPLQASVSRIKIGEQRLRTISVTAVDAVCNRSRAIPGYYSDRDQAARSPGDKIASQVARFASTVRADFPRFE
jgi:hypothetical protein